MFSRTMLLLLVATPALAALNHPANAKGNKALHKALTERNIQAEEIETLPMYVNKKACWMKYPVAMTQLAARVYKFNQTLPGAGINVADQKGYGTVTKDGFFGVACIKDYMYHHGDFDGPNKHEYEIGSSSNVSIAHYNMLVPKEDQQPMTAEVCFEFCRTVPDMLFFGLTAGRECYCLPFFKQMAGDSSKCDAVCEGNPTTMCGGMAKSNIFEMHFCDSTAGDLAAAAEKAGTFLEESEPQAKDALSDVEALQTASADAQDAFGKAGDTVMSDLLQSGKVFAGECKHAIEDAMKTGEELSAIVDDANGMEGADFTDPEKMKKAEDLMKKIEETLTKLEEEKEKAMDLHELARGAEYTKAGELEEVEGEPLKQFYPIMYFVDKEYDGMPSTCGGETLKKPIVAKSAQDCAAACSSEGIACAGFSYVSLTGSEDKVCFMFSKFKSVTYYTECKSFLQKPVSFLQKEGPEEGPGEGPGDAPDTTMCYAKFSSFTGTTLKPDPSGKCDLCLKTADKAQRCFE
eukprot:gnl/MRDRNA2_/MRDRNA2_82059_c0_seq1.p1 gnl/MRDRNA2_/MRDRNA2_82059_c0~~gnl/MRDRNA2_/MRDRNA2_82059_c0_seq1.p1  ORF type:complete len:519 (+),score=159.29 gnl/MRDRNA2_/MRDRNA2_82059_c0_seq1:84-1640(+)